MSTWNGLRDPINPRHKGPDFDWRAKHYAKARETCNAPRGWESWEPWEDRLVVHLVEGTATLYRTVRDVAKRLERTENAILCRIEKRYGENARNNFLHLSPDNTRRWAECPGAYNLDGTIMDWKTQAHRDAEVFNRVVRDIERMRNWQPLPNDALNERWAYRVTREEESAIARHLERSDIGWNKTGPYSRFTRSISHYMPPRHWLRIMGVELVRRSPFTVPVTDTIKDWSESG